MIKVLTVGNYDEHNSDSDDDENDNNHDDNIDHTFDDAAYDDECMLIFNDHWNFTL